MRVCPLPIRCSLGVLVALLVACADPAPPTPPPAAAAGPDGEAMVAAANPYAVDAGLEMLRAGGSAVDAAIAAHAVLGLVEPQSSGLGGGGFMLVYEADDDALYTIDGRETAPAGAFPEMFLDADGSPLSHLNRVQSGHAIGVPGTVALYHAAHERLGRLDWARLFQPAIELAENGFEVSPRLHGLLERIAGYTRIEDNPDTAAYFFPDGEPLPVGYLRDNPAYARTLRRIAREGPDGFYRGPVAAMIAAEAAEPPRPGTLTVGDMAGYEVRVRDAVCAPYRDLRVCSAPPPASGVAVLEILGLMERLAPDGMTPDAAGWAAFIDAMKLGYADRDHYVADPDYVPVPTDGLTDPRYWAERVAAVPPPADPAAPGDPGAVLEGDPIRQRWGRDPTEEVAGTSHLAVIDPWGNAVSFTASVEFAFGAQRMAAGFVLNNELTDFASRPTIDGDPVANAVAPGKRPRSSMSPVIAFDENGELFMATGSPGGNSIIAYNLKSILGVVDLGLAAQEAVALPNVVARDLPVRVEGARAPEGLVDALIELGYPVEAGRGENSGLHTIVVRAEGLEGGADPRREGRALKLEATALPDPRLGGSLDADRYPPSPSEPASASAGR